MRNCHANDGAAQGLAVQHGNPPGSTSTAHRPLRQQTLAEFLSPNASRATQSPPCVPAPASTPAPEPSAATAEPPIAAPAASDAPPKPAKRRLHLASPPKGYTATSHAHTKAPAAQAPSSAHGHKGARAAAHRGHGFSFAEPLVVTKELRTIGTGRGAGACDNGAATVPTLASAAAELGRVDGHGARSTRSWLPPPRAGTRGSEIAPDARPLGRKVEADEAGKEQQGESAGPTQREEAQGAECGEMRPVAAGGGSVVDGGGTVPNLVAEAVHRLAQMQRGGERDRRVARCGTWANDDDVEEGGSGSESDGGRRRQRCSGGGGGGYDDVVSEDSGAAFVQPEQPGPRTRASGRGPRAAKAGTAPPDGTAARAGHGHEAADGDGGGAGRPVRAAAAKAMQRLKAGGGVLPNSSQSFGSQPSGSTAHVGNAYALHSHGKCVGGRRASESSSGGGGAGVALDRAQGAGVAGGVTASVVAPPEAGGGFSMIVAEESGGLDVSDTNNVDDDDDRGGGGAVAPAGNGEDDGEDSENEMAAAAKGGAGGGRRRRFRGGGAAATAAAAAEIDRSIEAVSIDLAAACSHGGIVSAATTATAAPSGATVEGGLQHDGEQPLPLQPPSFPEWNPRRPGYVDLWAAVAYRQAVRRGQLEAVEGLPQCWGAGLLGDKLVLCNTLLHGSAAAVIQAAIGAALQDRKLVHVEPHEALSADQLRRTQKQFEERLRRGAAERRAAAAAESGAGAAARARKHWERLTHSEILESLPEFIHPSHKVQRVLIGGREEPDDPASPPLVSPWDDVPAMAGQESLRVRPGCSLEAGEFIGVYSGEGWLHPDWQEQFLQDLRKTWDDPHHPCPYAFKAARKHDFGRYAADCPLPASLLEHLDKLKLPADQERVRTLLEEEPRQHGQVFLTAARLGCLLAAANDPRRNLQAMCDAEADFREGGPNAVLVNVVVLGLLPVLVMVATRRVEAQQHVMYSYGHGYWALHEEEAAVCGEMEELQRRADEQLRVVRAELAAARQRERKHQRKRREMKHKLMRLRASSGEHAAAAKAQCSWEEERGFRVAAEEELRRLRAEMPPPPPAQLQPPGPQEQRRAAGAAGSGAVVAAVDNDGGNAAAEPAAKTPAAAGKDGSVMLSEEWEEDEEESLSAPRSCGHVAAPRAAAPLSLAADGAAGPGAELSRPPGSPLGKRHRAEEGGSAGDAGTDPGEVPLAPRAGPPATTTGGACGGGGGGAAMNPGSCGGGTLPPADSASSARPVIVTALEGGCGEAAAGRRPSRLRLRRRDSLAPAADTAAAAVGGADGVGALAPAAAIAGRERPGSAFPWLPPRQKDAVATAAAAGTGGRNTRCGRDGAAFAAHGLSSGGDGGGAAVPAPRGRVATAAAVALPASPTAPPQTNAQSAAERQQRRAEGEAPHAPRPTAPPLPGTRQALGQQRALREQQQQQPDGGDLPSAISGRGAHPMRLGAHAAAPVQAARIVVDLVSDSD